MVAEEFLKRLCVKNVRQVGFRVGQVPHQVEDLQEVFTTLHLKLSQILVLLIIVPLRCLMNVQLLLQDLG